MQFSLILILFSVSSYQSVSAQQNISVRVITSGTNTSLRGMSAPSEKVVWVSGSNGTVGKSTNGGKSWRWLTVPGFEKRDFRDIEAFDSSTAIIMAIDNPATILKTTDGGATWKIVFEKAMEGMFLDAMDFKNIEEGICIGDPVNLTTGPKVFYIIRTIDDGDSWTEAPLTQMPVAETGEAIFSASGTNISFLNNPDYEFSFITGGTVSKLHFVGRGGNKRAISIPIISGKETTGAFSFATDKQKTFYTIGGDYKVPGSTGKNFYYTSDTGVKWNTTSNGPSGYRSCVRIIDNKTLIACGPTGVDYAANGQKEWRNVSQEGFNVCMVSKGKQVFFAGEKGKIGILIRK